MTAYSGAVASGVLYDAPGPRTRRLTVIGGAFAAVVAAAAFYVLVLQPLADKGQLSSQLWGPLVDPANENFRLVWQRIGHGAANTLIAAAWAIVAALAFGTVLAVVRVQLKALGMRRFAGVPALAVVPLRALSWLLGAVTRAFVEVFRGLPVVITIFFAGRGLPEFGISFDNDMWYVVIGLTIYNGVVIAEILRSGMEGLPAGQSEASAALGLMPLQTTRIILLPQAYRIMLPALISQLVVVLKDTSLGFIVSYEETLEVAKQIIGALGNPIPVYFVIGAGFIAVNYVLSWLARYVQHRLARGSTGR
jgi:glutamate transport system permease protein